MIEEPILIWGSGAIGGVIGAYLVHAGHDVHFVDIVPQHVQAIAEGNLRIDGPINQFTCGGPAFLPDDVRGKYKLVLLAVKSQATDEAARSLAGHLADDGAVVSCQNGLNEPVIKNVVGVDRTIGAFVNFGADYQGPGHITYGIRGAVVVGELSGADTPRIRALHRLFADFEPDTVRTDNINGYLWGKLAYGAMLTYTALTNDTIADVFADPRRRPALVALAREILTVAHAEGVLPVGFSGFEPDAFLQGDAMRVDRSMQALVDYNRGSGKPHTGIWRDLVVRKRPTEVPAQAAPVREAALRHGVPTPNFDRLAAMIAGIEAGQYSVGDRLADEIPQASLQPK